jgi:hypothetical protein
MVAVGAFMGIKRRNSKMDMKLQGDHQRLNEEEEK